MYLLVTLVYCVSTLLASATGQACPGGYRFTTQPPSQLNCDSVGRFISLQCVSGLTSDSVTWYWSPSVCDAGISGTAILPGDNSDAYNVATLGSTNNKQISFTVTNSTLGYYWCEIGNSVNVSLRPSTITPVLQPHETLPVCTTAHVSSIHNSNPECAAIGSPVTYSRSPSPASCTLVISSLSVTPLSTYSVFSSPFSSLELAYTDTVTSSSHSLSLSSLSHSNSPSTTLVHNASDISSLVMTSLVPTNSNSMLRLIITTSSLLSTSLSSLITVMPSITFSLLSIITQTPLSSTMQQVQPSVIQDTPSWVHTISIPPSSYLPVSLLLTPCSQTRPNTTETIILVSLIVVCAVLAVVAVIIILAIIVLCVLTRKGRSRPQLTFKGEGTGDTLDGIVFRELGSDYHDQKEYLDGHSILQSPMGIPQQQDTKSHDSMVISELYVSNRVYYDTATTKQSTNTTDFKSFSNPVYDVGSENTNLPIQTITRFSPPAPSGDAGSNLLSEYSQPFVAQRRQQSNESNAYNKLSRITPSPVLCSPVEAATSCSQTRMKLHSAVEQDYDEVAVTPELDRVTRSQAQQVSNVTYCDDAVVLSSSLHHQSVLPPPPLDLNSPTVNIHTTSEPQFADTYKSETQPGSEEIAGRPNLFDDPSYATPSTSPHSSDKGRKVGQFQFSAHYEVDPHFK